MGTQTRFWVRQSAFLAFSVAIVTATTQEVCPSGCTCFDKQAICKGLQGVLEFPQHIANVSVSDSHDLIFNSLTFSENITDIKIAESLVTSINSGSFNKLSFLKNVEFTGTMIKSIESFAFIGLNTSLRIAFRNSQVDYVKSRGFTDLVVSEISFVHVLVANLEHYAFHNSKIDSLAFHDCEMKVIKSSAFNAISVPFAFQLVNTTVSEVIEKHAFSNLGKFSKTMIKGCKFANISCNSIMALFEATPKESYSFTFSTVRCTCAIVDMVYFIRQFMSAPASVKCSDRSGSQSGLPVANFNIQEMCPNEPDFDTLCVQDTPQFPSCPSAIVDCDDLPSPLWTTEAPEQSTTTIVRTTKRNCGCTSAVSLFTQYILLVLSFYLTRKIL